MAVTRSAGVGSEAQLHKAVADYLDWCLLPPAVYTTFPAGWYKLPKGTGGIMRGAGLKAGMPDLLLFHAGRTFGIELKVATGRQTEAQREMQKKLEKAGVYYAVIRDLNELVDYLGFWKVPLRNSDIAA